MNTFGPDPGTILDLYREGLCTAAEPGQLDEFSLTPLDHLGLPLWTVSLIGRDGALADGFGYGPDEVTAKLSAWGETLEWYWARRVLNVCRCRLRTG